MYTSVHGSAIHNSQKVERGTFLAVQWLRLHTFNAASTGSVPGWGTKIQHAVGSSQKKKKV